MKLWKRILLVWVLALVSFIVSFELPHVPFTIPAFISYSLQLLLFIISLFLIKHETVKKNKYIFVNFALFFSLSIYFHLYNFVGTIFFPSEPLARFFVNQYIGFGAYFFLLAIAVVYLTVDALFREFKTYQKYILCFLIAGSFFSYYYQPYFEDPKHLYQTDDLMDWKTIDKFYTEYVKTNGLDPSPEEIASSVEMYSWKKGAKVGVLYPEEKLNRVFELHPYLPGDNYKVLLYKPIYMNTIYMSVLSLAFILLFFGYQYKKDPPQGAYIEKMMFMFLVLATMEIFHAWSYIKSIEWQSYSEIVGIGQYLSTVVLFFITIFFSLRLRFITSVKGEFYEQEIMVSPNGVTRWRDALDNLVIAHFFNRKTLLGRLFVDPGVK